MLDGIPAGLPALARAQKVLGRARRAGLSVGDANSLLSASEATGGTDVAGVNGPGDASGLGRALLEIAVAAEAAGVDAEAALRTAVRDLEAALRRAEAADDRDLSPTSRRRPSSRRYGRHGCQCGHPGEETSP